jgi:hypothetical protein
MKCSGAPRSEHATPKWRDVYEAGVGDWQQFRDFRRLYVHGELKVKIPRAKVLLMEGAEGVLKE